MSDGFRNFVQRRARLLLALLIAAPASAPGGTLEEILHDGFESGAACAWSAVTSPTIPGGCVIAGVCYAPGATDPQNQGCRTCDPAVSQTAWQVVNNGGLCSDGDACTLGDVCNSGVCQPSGVDSCNDGFACTDDSCVSPTGCLHVPHDTACDDLLACTVNSCVVGSGCQTQVSAGSCAIDGDCYDDGELSPANPCLACDADVDPTAFTPRPVDTVCGAGSCTSETGIDFADRCDAFGTCVDAGSGDCSPFDCSGGACLSHCDTSSECDSTHYCSAGNCLPKKEAGLACTATEQCSSNFCVDSVCCVSACGGLCEQCAAGTGACNAVPAGNDPANECDADPPSTCQLDGTCSGTRSCRLYVVGTQCVPAQCTGTSPFFQGSDPADSCSGTGFCVSTPPIDCGNYLCNNATGLCRTSCTVDFQCDAGFTCQGGFCV